VGETTDRGVDSDFGSVFAALLSALGVLLDRRNFLAVSTTVSSSGFGAAGLGSSEWALTASVTVSVVAVFDVFLERPAFVVDVDFLIGGTTARFEFMAKNPRSWRQLYIARIRLYKQN
jgi:hypothetical protein